MKTVLWTSLACMGMSLLVGVGAAQAECRQPSASCVTNRGVDVPPGFFLGNERGSIELPLNLESGEPGDGGLGNIARVSQFGDGNLAEVTQTGTDNEAVVNQFGDRNLLGITQNGNDNTFVGTQIGSGLSLDYSQNGGESIAVTQIGVGSGQSVTIRTY